MKNNKDLPKLSFFRHSSRDGSPASSYRHQEKAPSSTPAPTNGELFDEMPDQMPVTPVLILLVLYITFGKSILKINFKSQVCSSYWRVKINPFGCFGAFHSPHIMYHFLSFIFRGSDFLQLGGLDIC